MPENRDEAGNLEHIRKEEKIQEVKVEAGLGNTHPGGSALKFEFYNEYLESLGRF